MKFSTPTAFRAAPTASLFAVLSPCFLQADTALTGDQALQSLQEGNFRFVAGQAEHSNQSAGLRAELTEARASFATVPMCSASRVPAEAIFAQCKADLFIARVAGNFAKTKNKMS